MGNTRATTLSINITLRRVSKYRVSILVENTALEAYPAKVRVNDRPVILTARFKGNRSSENEEIGILACLINV